MESPGQPREEPLQLTWVDYALTLGPLWVSIIVVIVLLVAG